MKNKRENWIDYLRGMGAIFVLLGHLVSYSSKLKFYLYSFHMPLFFFISGYLFKYEKNYLKLIKKNLKKLILPYLFFGVLTIIIVVLLGEKIYFIDAVKGLSFFNGSFPWNTSLWFFIVLFYSIIITNIIVGIVKNNKCAFTFVFCINIIICYMIKRLNITLPFGINITFFSLIFYWLGYIIKNNYFHIKNIICKVYNYKLIIIPIVILFILSFYISYKNERIVMSQCIYPRFIIFIFLSMVGIFIYSFIAKKIRYGKILKIFSELSLIMFSTQRILFRFIDIISRKLDIVLIGSNNYIVVFIIFVVILLFYLLYYKIKKIGGELCVKKLKD